MDIQEDSPTSNRRVLTVTDLNRQVRHLLEGEFPAAYVEGEISNLARPNSGHIYFSLKDDRAQLRCAMFRNRNQHLNFRPKDGMQVIVRGRISLYEGRGEYQMVVDAIEEAGEGLLQRAFEKLKRQLADEGLFEESIKKSLPLLPQHLGIITSPTGAAVRDVLHVLARRFPGIRVTILPVQVQGDESSSQIVKALTAANRYEKDPFDLLLLTRGGGSLEDLWSFNTEQVARAIHQSKLPVISAIGHETDFSIADYVADLRAPTPSAAAEMLSPDQQEWMQASQRMLAVLNRLMQQKLAHAGQQQDHLSRRLRNPIYRLQENQQRADELQMRLNRAIKQQIDRLKMRLALRRSRLASPAHQMQRLAERLSQHEHGLRSGLKASLERKKQAFRLNLQNLNALSPLATLERGYAIVTLGDSKTQVIKSFDEVSEGEMITARLMNGSISAEVKESFKAEDSAEERFEDTPNETDN